MRGAAATAAVGGGGHGGDSVGALDIIRLFAQEALGGAALGLAFGYIAYLALKSINEHNLEVLITLALVMLTYGVAAALHLSGPIAVVIAVCFGNGSVGQKPKY